jgi:NADH dehydrogenase FAD-containing subunit
MSRGVTFYTATVEHNDLLNCQVALDLCFENRRDMICFHYLVLAPGAITDLSRMPGMSKHALLAKKAGGAL